MQRYCIIIVGNTCPRKKHRLYGAKLKHFRSPARGRYRSLHFETVIWQENTSFYAVNPVRNRVTLPDNSLLWCFVMYRKELLGDIIDTVKFSSIKANSESRTL